MDYFTNLIVLTLGFSVCIGVALALIVALPKLIEFRKKGEKFS